jgi:hypothetical protein
LALSWRQLGEDKGVCMVGGLFGLLCMVTLNTTNLPGFESILRSAEFAPRELEPETSPMIG